MCVCVCVCVCVYMYMCVCVCLYILKNIYYTKPGGDLSPGSI